MSVSILAVKYFIPSKFVAELPEIGIFSDEGEFDAGDIGEIAHVLSGQVLAIPGVVGAAGGDPGGAAGGHIGVGFPEDPGNGQVGQRVRRCDGFYFVYEEAEAVTHIDDGGVDGGARGGVKDEA